MSLFLVCLLRMSYIFLIYRFDLFVKSRRAVNTFLPFLRIRILSPILRRSYPMAPCHAIRTSPIDITRQVSKLSKSRNRRSIACRWILKLTGLAVGALTVKAANTIDAGSPVEAGSTCAIVDVDAAVRPGPAIHAYARVATG